MDHATETASPRDLFMYSVPVVGKIPDEIKPYLDLMNLTAMCFEYDPDGYNRAPRPAGRRVPVRYWKINNDKTLKYVRIDAETLGQDADKWREVLGLLLDHGNGTIK